MVEKDLKIILKIADKYSFQIDEVICPILNEGYRYCDHGHIINILKSIKPYEKRDKDILRIAIKTLEDKDVSLQFISDRVRPESDYTMQELIDNLADSSSDNKINY